MSAPGDRGWTDERIKAAYRAMAGSGRAPDLRPPALEPVRRQGFGRSESGVRPRFGRPMSGRPRFGRALGAVVGVAAGLLVVVLVAALLVYRGGRTTAGSPEPSAEPSSFATPPLPAQTVSQAIAAMAAGGLTDTDLLAVQGWLQPVPIVPIMACPTFMPEYAFGIPSDLRCGATIFTLAEPEDGQGPNFQIVVLDGTSLPEQLVDHPSTAHQAVVVGHVHDRRASLCSAAVRAACEAAFVLDQVAWLDGTILGPSVGAVSGQSNPKSRMSEAQVLAALDPVLAPGSTVVSMTAVSVLDAYSTYSPGFAPSDEGGQVVWYVRVFGPQPTSLPMPGSQAGSGLLVLDDAGPLLGAAGWAWDPARAGIEMRDGTISLHTSNWLPGGLCAGVGIDATLTGSRTDPTIAWLTLNPRPFFTPDPSAPPMTLIWPAGYRARFDPQLAILDASGSVVLREGDHVGGACVGSETNTLYMEPPFL